MANPANRHQRLQIGEAVGRGIEYDYGDRQHIHILLERKVTVGSDKHVNFSRCERGQFSVLDRRPAHLAGGHHLMIGEAAGQPPVDALVEKYLHSTVSTRRSFAASRNSMTCSRDTDGKPARNSSIDSPASR